MSATLLAALTAATEEPRHALVFAMLLSYGLGFAGMLLAYLSYRKRQKSGKPAPEKPQPPAAGGSEP
jgi:cytochrome c biogenesis protein CcdA